MWSESKLLLASALLTSLALGDEHHHKSKKDDLTERQRRSIDRLAVEESKLGVRTVGWEKICHLI